MPLIPESALIEISNLKVRVAELEDQVKREGKMITAQIGLRDSLRNRLLDLENTVSAIADPDDYEAGGEKTAETCRRLASECMARNDL